MSAKHFIAAAYDFKTEKTGKLWFVTTVHNDLFESGDAITVNGKEYLLGHREIDKGEVASYELILRSEVLEL